jgi:hypothetical protein
MSNPTQTTQSPEPKASDIPPSIQGTSLSSLSDKVIAPPEQKAETKLKKEPQPTKTKKTENHAAFANDLHGYIRDHIQLADQKAVFLFAAVGTMLAFLHGKGITKIWMTDPRQWHLPEVFSFVAVIGLLIGALASFWVIVPRLRGAPRGFIYWKSIKLFENKSQYATHILSCDAEALITAKLEHCHELAVICTQKYRAVSLALWCGGIGLLAGIFYLALF